MKLTKEQIRNSRILVVGDNSERLLLGNILVSEGYHIDTVVSSKLAFDKTLKNQYALFIIDEQMSEINSNELGDSLRRICRSRNIPILYISELGGRIKYEKQEFENGGVDYIFKPVNHELLKIKVQTLIRVWCQELELAKAYEKMRSINENLESLIEIKTHELRRKNQDLQQFAYLAAHDLKEPIGNISSLLTMINEENGIKSESQVLFEKTFRAVEQLQKKIGHLNEVIAVKDKFNLEPEELNFNQILDEVKSNIEVDLKGKNAMIKADFSVCETIHFPKIHLVSILQNLISNSVKYSQNGKTPVINVLTTNQNGFICLTVKDNGRGMDLNIYGNKLFKLFQRFHLDEHGKGIGLHLVNEIVENYGGHIDVASQVNEGTTFKIFLKSLAKG